MKDASTNSLYQSTFLPIIQKAETKIKLIVLSCFLYGYSPAALRYAIAGVILALDKKLPADLANRDAYIKGVYRNSELLIKKYYEQPRFAFLNTRAKILETKPNQVIAPKLENPKELLESIKNNKILWSEAKGSPNVIGYEKEIKQYINGLSKWSLTTSEEGKKPITLWQKAELDVRYENQMQMLQDLRTKGVRYAWTSSHVNASKRCAKWQGKLMALEGHATQPNFKMGFKLGGYEVYSLVDIMAQTDKYGYHNNIINGFNCRHRLIPYVDGQKAPTHYDKGEIAEQRAIETRIRNMEREIRLEKTKMKLYDELGDKKIYNLIKMRVNRMVEIYKKYCERNGYAWHRYRIDI